MVSKLNECNETCCGSHSPSSSYEVAMLYAWILMALPHLAMGEQGTSHTPLAERIVYVGYLFFLAYLTIVTARTKRIPLPRLSVLLNVSIFSDTQ